jgi:biopolymer transport protein ExbD
MRFRAGERAQAEINLTPLIDILFIVLLFLVMTATFARRTFVQIDLPEAATGAPEGTDPSVIRIDLDAGSRLYLAGQALTVDGLRRHLGGLAAKEGLTVVLAADERTPHGQVVQIIDVVRASAIPRLHLETVPAAPP